MWKDYWQLFQSYGKLSFIKHLWKAWNPKLRLQRVKMKNETNLQHFLCNKSTQFCSRGFYNRVGGLSKNRQIFLFHFCGWTPDLTRVMLECLKLTRWSGGSLFAGLSSLLGTCWRRRLADRPFCNPFKRGNREKCRKWNGQPDIQLTLHQLQRTSEVSHRNFFPLTKLPIVIWK